MTLRHLITRATVAVTIAGAVFGATVSTANAEPTHDALNGTTMELALDAQAFISYQLISAKSIKEEVPWPRVINLDNGFEMANLQEKRDIDTLGVMQAIAARTFEFFGESDMMSACLTGALVASYANYHQVTDTVSKREMLYALAYVQFEAPGTKIEEAIMATTMMDYPPGVYSYHKGVTSGSKACRTTRPTVIAV